MRRYVWLMGLLVACDGGETTEPTTPQVQEPVAQEPEVKEPSLEEKIAAVRGLSLAGKHAEALQQAEALLGENPDNDGLWRMMLREARASDSAKALYERLDAASPIGGRAEAHHALRAELALDLGMVPEGLAAAQSAGNSGLIVRALLDGATIEAAPDAAPDAPPSPEQALHAVLTSDKAVDEAVAAEAAKATGWQADMLRARKAKQSGDLPGALASCDKAAAAGDPSAVFAANITRAGLAMVPGEGTPTAEQAIGWASAAAKAALEDGDGGGLAAAMRMLVRLNAMQVSSPLAEIEGLHRSVVETYGGEAGSLTGIILAQVQLSHGMPAEAHQTAAEARALLTDRPEAADAAWVEGFAAHQLGRIDAVAAAAEASEGARKQALQAMASLADGMPATATHAFPTAGLSDRDMAYVGVEAAIADADKAIEHLRRAVDAADATGDPALRVYTRLAYEQAARATSHPDAATLRAELLGIFPETPEGLAAEVAVRTALSGGNAAVSGEAGILQAWAALGNSSAAPEGVTGAGTAGLVAWAKGRAGAGASAYNEALGTLPSHRQGGLFLGTVLDGSQGVGVHADLAKLGNDLTDLDSAMSCHELGHRIGMYRDDVAMGRDLTHGVPEAEREALRAAVAKARAGMLTFQLGGAWPEEALAAVEAAEKAAGTASNPFQRLLPIPGTPISGLRESQPGTSFLSFLDVNGRMHGIAVTPDGGGQKDVGSTAQLYATAAEHYAALKASGMADGYADHRPGNLLRVAFIDSFSEELSGFGRFQVIAPGPLLQVSFTTFPEQSSGLRWLADIRTIAQIPSLKTVMLPQIPVQLYVPDFLGVGAPEEPAPPEKEVPEGEEGGTAAVAVENPDKPKLQLPTGLGLASRQFGADFRVMLVGEEANHEKFKEHSATARYLYISDLDPTPDGGFEIVGGALSLSEILANPVPGKVIFIASPAPGEVQVARARAFMEAGAESVIVINWEAPESAMRRFITTFFETLNRDLPASRALGEGRSALLRDSLLGDEARDPGIWGSIVFFGKP